MSDLPDDLPADDDVEPTERLALPSLDSFKAVRDLIALVIDPRSVKRHLRQLHDALAAITAAQRQLESDRAAFAEYEKATRAELTADRAKLREGETALQTNGSGAKTICSNASGASVSSKMPVAPCGCPARTFSRPLAAW